MLAITSLSKDVISKEANVLTKNLLQEIKKVEEKFQPQNREWAEEVLDVLRFCVGANEGLSLGTLCVLYMYKTHWEELPIEFRKEYDFQFNILVVRETAILPETLDNYFRTVKTFVIEGKKPFGTIEIPKRDKYRNLIVEEGEILTEQVEFDPTKIPITKLSLMRSAVEKNEMPDSRWSMLMDAGVTTTQIKQELYRRETPSDPDPSLQYKLYGNVIVAQEFGEERVVGTFNFEQYGEDEVATRMLKDAARRFNIKLDEEVIDTVKKHGFLERLGNETESEQEG